MGHFSLVGIVAGLAAALLFASVATNSPLTVLLFYAAPLPILIAGLGWRHWAAPVATVIGAVVLGFVFDFRFVFAFVVGVGVPAWAIAYLALLARQDGAGNVEWFPLGHIVFWSALIGAGGLSIGILTVGGSSGGYTASLRMALEQVLRTQTGIPAGAPITLPNISDVDAVIDAMVAALPLVAAVLSMFMLLLNLWGAALVARRSGRLTRPWPSFLNVRMPSVALPALAGAFVIAMFGDLLGLLARLFATTLTMAYGLAGLSTMHAVSRGISGRTTILAAIYAAIVLFSGWPFVLASMVGVADSLFDLRRRFRGRRGPPAAND